MFKIYIQLLYFHSDFSFNYGLASDSVESIRHRYHILNFAICHIDTVQHMYKHVSSYGSL